MAPIKFEEHIKDKLEQREIEPSAGSWDTLSSRLNGSEKRSGNKWWLPAAAAVAVIMFASIFFVNQQQISNPIVETPTKEDVQNDAGINDPKQPVQLSSEINNEAIQEEIKKPELIKKVAKQTERIAVQNRSIETEVEENAIANQSQSRRALKEPVEILKAEVVETSTRPLYEKAQDVLAKIYQGEKSPEDYTEAEVDALLAEAAQNISNDRRAYGAFSVNVDDLLADVEYEVDQSFRKEVFDFLKEEFLKAKTAVATRND